MNKKISRLFTAILACIALSLTPLYGQQSDWTLPHVPDRLLLIRSTNVTEQIIIDWHALQDLGTLGKLKAGHRIHLAELRLPPGQSAEGLAKIFKASGHFDVVEPDYIIEGSAVPDDPDYANGELWGLENTGQKNGTEDADIDAATAWDTVTDADNVVVGVIDSGVRYTHSDLAANMWVNQNEIPGNGIDDDHNGVVDDVHGYNAITGSGDPMDDNGHGTHCSGTIGAVGNNGIGSVGVAWKAKIMGLKFLGASGAGATSDAIKCIGYAQEQGVTVLNNSWGGTGYSQALENAIEALKEDGIIFVVAAGNDNVSIELTPHYPAALTNDNIITVASTTRNDSRSSFSNVGFKSVDLGAPGSRIYSTWNTSDFSYHTIDGTSMAAPHVAGAVAMLRALRPFSQYREVIDTLLETTDPIPQLEGITVTGGRLNLAAAIAKFNEPPPEPIVIFDPDNSDQAIGIEDLEVDGVLYNVSFSESIGASGPYGSFPGTGSPGFDFTSLPNVHQALIAVNVQLSMEGVAEVGAEEEAVPQPTYYIGYRADTDEGGSLMVNAWSGSTLGTGSTNIWLRSENEETLSWDDASVIWADFELANPPEPEAPTISVQPTSQTTTPGSTVVFSVLAAGTDPLSYQWQHDGVALPGATSTDLVLTNITTSQAGTYRVAVTNSVGSVMSLPAILLVHVPPVITDQPDGQTVVEGDRVTFRVEATGSAPLSYGWQRNGNWIQDATSSTLVIPTAQLADSGVYRVEVRNSVGSAWSDPAPLTVNEPQEPPTILVQPTSQIVDSGATVVFSVLAIGTDPLSYQWLQNGVEVSGASSTDLVLENVQIAQEGVYHVVVSNAGGSELSAPATLTVNIPAPEPTVIFDSTNPDQATGIMNLMVAGVLYNVAFTEQIEAYGPYGPFPGESPGFDFNDALAAQVAQLAANIQLTAAGATQVAAEGTLPAQTYYIGFSSGTATGQNGQNAVNAWESSSALSGGSTWVRADDADALIYDLDTVVWADFTLVEIVLSTLSITNSAPNEVMISWTPDTPGFVLQESTNLVTGTWIDAPTGVTNPATGPATESAKFFRLRTP